MKVETIKAEGRLAVDLLTYKGERRVTAHLMMEGIRERLVLPVVAVRYSKLGAIRGVATELRDMADRIDAASVAYEQAQAEAYAMRELTMEARERGEL